MLPATAAHWGVSDTARPSVRLSVCPMPLEQKRLRPMVTIKHTKIPS